MKPTQVGNKRKSSIQKSRHKICLGLFWAVAVFAAPAVFGLEERTPVFVDADLSQAGSQLTALAYAMRSTEVHLAGIATVTSPLQEAANLIGDWMLLCGRHDLPLFTGPGKSVTGIGPLREWVPETSPSVPDRDACEGLIEVSKSESGKLQVVILGSPLRVGAALEKDPSLPGRLRALHWVWPCNDAALLNSEERAAAQRILDTTLPVFLYPTTPDLAPPIQAEWLESVGKTHSVLTDAVTRMLATDLDLGAGPNLGSVLPFLHIGNRAGLEITDSSWEITAEGGLREGGSFGMERVRSVTAEDVYQTVRSNLTDVRRDFSLEFTRFLFGLSKLSPDSRTQVQSALKQAKEKGADEVSQKDPNDLRHQMLAFIEDKLDALEGIEDPEAKTLGEELKQVHCTVAGIGWYFPADFYGRWFWPAREGQPLSLEFGVSNSSVRPIENVQATLLYGSQVKSQEVLSATGDVILPFEIGPIKPAGETASKLDLFLSWKVSGVPASASLTLPLKIEK